MAHGHRSEKPDPSSDPYPEEDLIRHWGVVIYPTEIGEAPEWEIAKGRHEVDAGTGCHFVSPVIPHRGLERGTTGLSELDHDGRQQWRLSAGPNDWARSLVDLAGTVYYLVASLSEDRNHLRSQDELLERLLIEWIWRQQVRNADLETEMRRLMDTALSLSDAWEAVHAPGEPGTDQRLSEAVCRPPGSASQIGQT